MNDGKKGGGLSPKINEDDSRSSRRHAEWFQVPLIILGPARLSPAGRGPRSAEPRLGPADSAGAPHRLASWLRHRSHQPTPARRRRRGRARGRCVARAHQAEPMVLKRDGSAPYVRSLRLVSCVRSRDPSNEPFRKILLAHSQLRRSPMAQHCRGGRRWASARPQNAS